MKITGDSFYVKFETDDETELKKLQAFAEHIGEWCEHKGENGVIIEIKVGLLLAFEDRQIYAAG